MMKTSTLMIAILAATSCKGGDKSAGRVRSRSLDVATNEDVSTRTESMRDDGSPPGAAGGKGFKSPDAPPEISRSQAIASAHAAGVLGGDGNGMAMGFAAEDKPKPASGKDEDGKQANDRGGRGGGGGGAEVATRAWFPETFLFDPLVVTDAHGEATVPVRVPDRLTTWRVLALAHSRTGAQGGTVASFAGTLPAYVEPIVPKTLVVGDEVRIPIQLVNTTAAPIVQPLTVEADGATLTGAATGARTIPAGGSVVEYVTLSVARAGAVKLVAKLGDTDAVVRVIQVVPAGRPVITARSGTLAAPRTLESDAVAGADPATDRVRLQAFPGALALLRSELGVSTARTGTADDAYALLLAGKATALLASLGDKADPDALRDLTILTSQRVIRDARTLDVASATLIAEAALAHPQNPVLARIGERAAAFLAKAQRPDGTFDPATPASAGALPSGGGTGWTLQRVLVATADGTRAVGSATDTSEQRQRAEAIATRASGAFERNLDRVDDPFTAAAILASGGASGAIADKLRERVRAGIVPGPDKNGAKILAVGEGVVRADGLAPGTVEATALAVLALSRGTPTEADKAAMADLGATLLGSYSAERGWGDGRANLACMRAVLELFKAPVPENVKVTLAMDGKPVVEGTLSRDRLRDVLVLEAPAPGLAAAHTWTVAAEPAVPGLGFSLALDSWVPWQKEPVNEGLELAVPEKMTGSVGQPAEVTLTAVAPSGQPLHFLEPLPAGVQVDTPSLEALVSAGTIAHYEAADGKVELWVNALSPGQTFAAKLRVIPTLAGTLHARASQLDIPGVAETHQPPTVWTIK